MKVSGVEQESKDTWQFPNACHAKHAASAAGAAVVVVGMVDVAGELEVVVGEPLEVEVVVVEGGIVVVGMVDVAGELEVVVGEPLEVEVVVVELPDDVFVTGLEAVAG